MSQASFHYRGGTWALSGADARCCRLAWFRDFPGKGPLGPEWRVRERLARVYNDAGHYAVENGRISDIPLMTSRLLACTLIAGTRVPSVSRRG